MSSFVSLDNQFDLHGNEVWVGQIPYTINMKTVLLVRHGETLHNTQRVFQSDDAPLSDVGRRQI